MVYRDVLVHVDTTSEGRVRLTNAIHLSTRIGARLTGVGAVGFEPRLERTRGIFRDTLRKDVDARIEAAARVFRELAAGMQSATWQARVGPPLEVLTDLACGADLIFGSRVGQPESPTVFARPDSLVLASGIPVLLQPPEAKPLLAEAVVVGWKNTRASRRVIRDSLPMLKLAAVVRVVHLLPNTEDYIDELNLVEERLERRGVNVRRGQELRPGRSSYDSVMRVADDLNADLIVVGTDVETKLSSLLSDSLMHRLIVNSSKNFLLSH